MQLYYSRGYIHPSSLCLQNPITKAKKRISHKISGALYLMLRHNNKIFLVLITQTLNLLITYVRKYTIFESPKVA